MVSSNHCDYETQTINSLHRKEKFIFLKKHIPYVLSFRNANVSLEQQHLLPRIIVPPLGKKR